MNDTKRREHTRPLVLVTGSNGYIGTAARERLGRNFQVVGMDIHPPADEDPGGDWIECDLTDDDSVGGAIAELRERFGERIASVLHLSAYYDFSGEPSPMYEKLTVEGTRRLVRALRPLSVEQFVFASSLLVMQSVGPGDVIDESSPTEASWDYPRSKLETERLLREEARDMPTVILRIAGVYDEECHALPIAQQIARIDRKEIESFLFPGDSERGQPYVHIRDLTKLFRAVIDRRSRLRDWEIFLVAEPDILGYADLQERLGQLIHGRAWPTIEVPAALAKAGAHAKEIFGSDDFIKPWMIDLADAHYPASIDKAWKLLGWEPRLRLRRALPEMVRHLKEDRGGWYEANGLDAPPAD